MIGSSVRSQQPPIATAQTRSQLPRKIGPLWKALLVTVDTLSCLAAFFLIGLPVPFGIAGSAIVCGALWLCGAYRESYAVRARDEFYHVLVGIAAAMIPLCALLYLASDRWWLFAPSVALLSLALISFERCLLHAARRPANRPAYAGLESVSAAAQWRAQHALSGAVKRFADVVISATALVFLAPVMLATALYILVESGSPVVFRQTRTGRYGTPFTLFKFRTMRRDSDGVWVKPGDTRITKSGAFMRRSSLDELPQLINVLRGEMTLVGPRPEMCDYVARFEVELPHYRMRHIVKPGLTGWAQVQLKRNLEPSDVPEVLAYDLFYVEHWSPVLDAILFFKTAAEFLVHRGV